MVAKPQTALVAWPLEVLKLSTGRAKNARKASEWPSTTSNVSLVVTVTLASPIVCLCYFTSQYGDADNQRSPESEGFGSPYLAMMA